MILSRYIAVGLAISITLPAARAGTPEVEEIVARTEQAAYFSGNDGRAQVTMTISDRQGRERRRRMTILRKNAAPETKGNDARQKYYVYLHYPADVRDTVLMVWKQGERDDDRWLYMPALDLVRRIAAGDKRTSFLGSDFFYEDISGRNTDEDHHRLESVSDNYYVLHSTPKTPGSAEFASFRMWIHKTSYLPVKAEFYDAGQTPLRTYEALEVETIQDYPTVVRARMIDHRSGSQTELAFEEIAYDLDLEDGLFSERYLRNPPRRKLQ
ncbi:MAG: outer membrane lipoprotein-sorting protein [Pseudomonadota bacterium]